MGLFCLQIRVNETLLAKQKKNKKKEEIPARDKKNHSKRETFFTEDIEVKVAKALYDP